MCSSYDHFHQRKLPAIRYLFILLDSPPHFPHVSCLLVASSDVGPTHTHNIRHTQGIRWSYLDSILPVFDNRLWLLIALVSITRWLFSAPVPRNTSTDTAPLCMRQYCHLLSVMVVLASIQCVYSTSPALAWLEAAPSACLQEWTSASLSYDRGWQH